MPELSRGPARVATPTDRSDDDVVGVSACLAAAGVFPWSLRRRIGLAADLMQRHEPAAVVAAVDWHRARGRGGAWIAKCLADPVGVERTLASLGWHLPLAGAEVCTFARADVQTVEVLLLRAGLFVRAPAERRDVAARLMRQRFAVDDVATFLRLHLMRGATAAWIAAKLRAEPECVARAQREAVPVAVGGVNWIMRRRIEGMTALLASRWTVEEAPPVAHAPGAGVASTAPHVSPSPPGPILAPSVRGRDRSRRVVEP